MNFRHVIRSLFVTFFIGGILSLLTTSCEFTPGEVNFVKKDGTITNHLIVTLDSITPDTLLILEPTTISFNVQVGEGEYIHPIITITGPEVIDQSYTWQGTNFSVPIDPRNRKSGIYKLNITVTTGTGTGTLREKLRGEALVASFEKFLVVDNNPAEEITITSVKEEDGSVILRWPAYPHKNLNRIKVWRLTDHFYGTETKSFDISPDLTSYMDSSFAGGTAKYRLQTEVNDPNYVLGPFYTFTGQPSPSIKSFQPVKGTPSVNVTWTRFRYPSNFKSYQIFIGSGTLLHTITEIADTSYTLANNLRFGEYKRAYIRTETHGGYSIHNPADLVYVYPGKKTAVTWYKSLFFSQNTHRVYYFKPDRLGVWHDDVLTDSVSVNYAYTAPFKLMIPHAGTSLFVLNVGLAKYHQVNLSFEKHTQNYYCMAGKVTNDNLVIYSIKDSPNCYPDPNRPPGLALYDYSQGLSVDTLTTYPDPSTAPAITFTEIGYDERTLLIKNENEFRIATFDQTHFTRDEYVGIPTSFEAHFLPIDNDKIYGFNSTQTVVYSIATGQSTFNSLGETILLPELDQVSGWLGGMNASRTKYMIFDVVSGQKLKEVEIPPTSDYLDYTDPTTFYLWAKRLYMKPGFVLDLE